MNSDDELADALRAVLGRVHGTVADDARVREATALARQMYDLLEGEPRPRWFVDVGAEVDDRSARIDRHRFGDRSLFRGTANAIAPPLRIAPTTMPDGRPAIEGRVRLGPLYEGPPNGVHGGYVAGLFDEVLGATQSLIEGPTGLTGTLQVHYRNVTPIGAELVFVAWVHHLSGRRIQCRATCHSRGVLTANSEALFIRVDMAALARRAAARRPDQES